MYVHASTLKQTASLSTIRTIIYLVSPGLKTPWATHHGLQPHLHATKRKRKELRLRGGRHGRFEVIIEALGQGEKPGLYVGVLSRHSKTLSSSIFLPSSSSTLRKCPQSPLPAFQVIFNAQCKYCLIIPLSV